MRTRELIARLQRIVDEHGDIEVMLHAETEETLILDSVSSVTAEQDHADDQTWFVRLMVTDPE